MRVIKSTIMPLINKSIFRKVEVKIENKVGTIYLNSPKDLNALS